MSSVREETSMSPALEVSPAELRAASPDAVAAPVGDCPPGLPVNHSPLRRAPSATVAATPGAVVRVDYARLTDVQAAPDPQPDAARALWAQLLAHLPPVTAAGVFAGTVGLELAQSSAGLSVLIVGTPNAERARALDAGQSETWLQAALRAAAFPVRAVRFVPLAR